MYIVKPIEETAFETIVKKFDDLLAANGATVEKTDRWGKKRLAYEIKDFLDGIYVLVTFQGDGKTVKELDRVMKITDEILRHMIIKKGE
jgi:small subunit ribosomal protein S6